MILYRATDTGYTGHGSCWTPDRDCAEAYRGNPGYGGDETITREIEVARRDDGVLDVSDESTATWQRLAELAEREWTGNVAETFGGLSYAHAIVEDRIGTRRLAEAGYRWVIFTDSYPEHCETWMYLGEEAL